MSLTSILRDKRRQNIKNWFKHNFPNPGLKNNLDIIVLPAQEHSSYSSVIGTAFDYLFRFNLERINKNQSINRSNWIAEYGLKIILQKLELSDKNMISIGYNNEREIDRVEFKEFIESMFVQSQENYKKFINDGKLTDNLIKSTIFLAKLDTTYRARFIDSSLDNVENDKINELKELLAIVPWEKFQANNCCFLNPSFGKGSSLVGGADADFIIDNMLIDIKSSKNLKIERNDLNQIVGYYLLSIIGGINGNKNHPINDIGIYFARYGYLWKIPLSYYYTPKDYNKYADEFSQLVNDRTLKLIRSNNELKNIFFNSTSSYIIDENDFKCPHCEGKKFARGGKTSSGKFKYKCKICKKHFSTEIETTPLKETIKNFSFDD